MAKAFDVDTGGTLTTSLVSFYNFETSSIDEFGANNGSDTATVTYGGAGKIGNGIVIGTNGKVTATGFGSRSSASSFSFGGWVNFGSLPAVKKGLFAFSSPTAGDLTGCIYVHSDAGGADNRIRLSLFRQNQARDDAQSAINIFTTGWHLVVGVYNGTTLFIFIDGTQVGSLAASAILTSTTNTVGNFLIGADEQGAATGTGANFDMAFWYNKALSGTEHTDLFNGGTGNAYRTQAISISVSDAITVSESITGTNIDLNPSVSDTVTISESVSIDFPYLIFVSENVALTESVTMDNSQLGDINVSEAVTITESIIASNLQLGGISVFDAVTVSELVVMDLPVSISVGEDIAVSEAVTMNNSQLGDIGVSDTVTVSESLTMSVAPSKIGFVLMRSGAQKWPIGMDDGRVI